MKKHVLYKLICILSIITPLLLFNTNTGMSDDNVYVKGLWGLPEETIQEFIGSGINTLLLTKDEIPKASNLHVMKIYYNGAHAKTINQGNLDEVYKNMRYFKNIRGEYAFYLGDDLKCQQKETIDNFKKELQITKGIVGLLAGLQCYPEDDIIKYHYPLMRQVMLLSEMLKKQAKLANKLHMEKRKLYVVSQAHPQHWYQELVRLGNAKNEALLYPDGQVVRMLLYYSLATGADGYLLYNHKSLTGNNSPERVLAACQTIMETGPLSQMIVNNKGVLFFQKGTDLYGTKIEHKDYDIFFIFAGDKTALYHPSAKKFKVNLNNIIPMQQYAEVSKYSLTGTMKAQNEEPITQDCPLILIAYNKSGVKKFEGEGENLNKYKDLLSKRANQLYKNMKVMGIDCPTVPIQTANINNSIQDLNDFIDKVNDMKREVWLKKNKSLIDGEVYSTMFYNKKLRGGINPEYINFYYQ